MSAAEEITAPVPAPETVAVDPFKIVTDVLAALVPTLGESQVKEAARAFATRRRRRDKKERTKRGPTEWNNYVKEVWDDMKKSSEKVKYSQAMTEAKRRRDSAEADGAAVSQEAPQESKEERDAKVYNFLFDLQASGVTNMLGCVPYIQEEFGMERGEAEGYREEYMSSYRELRAKYRPEPEAPEGKKGRKRAAK
jgi:hypothetical protein